MKRPLLLLSALAAMLVLMPMSSVADAQGIGRGGGQGRSLTGGRGVGHGHGHRHGFGRGPGFGQGFGLGFGGFFVDDGDLAELYRELLKNVPYFALHPPVYYSYPVPRTYGYSPFAYPPGVMTPELGAMVEPLEIINPYVPSTKSEPEAKAAADTSAAVSRQPQPLVVINPYVTATKTLAKSGR